MVLVGEDNRNLVMTRETVCVTYTKKENDYYIWLPINGEASFLFPPVKKAEGRLIYTVDGLFSLYQRVCRHTKPAEIIELIQKILKAEQLLEAYLIDERNISWNPEHIYWHESRREIFFLYLPDGEGEKKEFWKTWGQGILQKAIGEGWTDETLLLFVLRFNQLIQCTEKIDWKQFIQEYQERNALTNELKVNKPGKKTFLFLPRR